MIDLTFHFCFFRGAELAPWRDIYTFCLKSCQRSAMAQKIVVYYDSPGEGLEWDAAHDLTDIVWKQDEFPTEYNDPRLISDIFKLQVLEREGGFACDLDFLFLSSFEKFRHNDAVIGVQCKAKRKLTCSIIGSKPNAEFVYSYIDTLTHLSPAQIANYDKITNVIPWELSARYPVTVLPRPVFFPWCWSNKKFLTGGALNVKQSAAMCVWGTVYPSITLDDLKKTSISKIIEKIETNNQPTAVTSRPGGILQFF